MAESIAFSRGSDRSVIYREIIPQLASLVSLETDPIANLANAAAVLKEALGFFWVGFYLAKEGELVLGPFQGPLACTRIKFGEGVCGTAYATTETLIVPDVDQFPGHIVCSSAARSEIVVPLLDRTGNPIGVLDVDSDKVNDLNDEDARGLEAIAKIVSARINLDRD
jgi:GAF domain-containing protein